MARSNDVDAFLANYPEAVQATASAARELVRAVLPNVEESLDRSAKVIGYGYGPGYKGLVCTLIMSQKGVKLGVYRGSELEDPKGLMTGAGKVHRHVPLISPNDVRQAGLKQLLKRALEASKARNTTIRRG
jgi:hypothetical protein